MAGRNSRTLDLAGAAERRARGFPGRRAGRRRADAGHLRDGTPVEVRPLGRADRELLLAGFGRLSRRSRYSRFQQGVSSRQFERMLPVLVDTVDQQRHVAIVLYAMGQPIGVSRLRRAAFDPGVADLAVTVADDWQGRGAGSLLAAQTLARAGGVREIHTVVGEDNQPSLRMLARLGNLRTDCVAGSCDVVVHVHDEQPDGAELTPA